MNIMPQYVFQYFSFTFLFFTFFMASRISTAQTQNLGPVSITPASIVAGTPTTVSATVTLQDPTLIDTSVDLIRTDSDGKSLQVLGLLHDDGMNGDLVAGDHIYSYTFSMNESAPGKAYFVVSAAFKGRLQRNSSPVASIDITASSSRAANLANTLLSAGSVIDRRNALINIFRELKVGIYSAAGGSTVVRGTEANDNDLYFYDFEVDIMAEAISDPASYTIHDLKQLLADVLPTADIELLSDDDFGNSFASGFKSRPAATDTGLLAGQLVREIGLRLPQAYDLYGDVNLSSIRLNQLQFLLVLIDLYDWAKGQEATIAPSVANAIATPNSSLLNFRSSQIKTGVSAAALEDSSSFQACVNLQNTGFEIGDGGKLFGAIVFALSQLPGAAEIIKRVGAYAALSITDIYEIHAIIMSRAVHYSTPTVMFHYRHDPAPAPLTWPFHVEMTLSLPQFLVKCGFLTGLKWPVKGPLSGVTVQFNTRQLGLYSTVTDCPNMCSKTTDSTGTASIEFDPNLEKQPGVGAIYSKDGTVPVHALVLNSLGNGIFGFLQKFVSIPLPFTASYHQGGIDGTIQLKMSAVLPETLIYQIDGGTLQESAAYTLSYNIQPIEMIANSPGLEVWRARWTADYNLSESATYHGYGNCDKGRTENTLIRNITGSGAASGGSANGYDDGMIELIVTDEGVQIISNVSDLSGTVSETALGVLKSPCDEGGSSETTIPPYPFNLDLGSIARALQGVNLPLNSDHPISVPVGPWPGIYIGSDTATLSINTKLVRTAN